MGCPSDQVIRSAIQAIVTDGPDAAGGWTVLAGVIWNGASRGSRAMLARRKLPHEPCDVEEVAQDFLMRLFERGQPWLATILGDLSRPISKRLRSRLCNFIRNLERAAKSKRSVVATPFSALGTGSARGGYAVRRRGPETRGLARRPGVGPRTARLDRRVETNRGCSAGARRRPGYRRASDRPCQACAGAGHECPCGPSEPAEFRWSPALPESRRSHLREPAVMCGAHVARLPCQGPGARTTGSSSSKHPALDRYGAASVAHPQNGERLRCDRGPGEEALAVRRREGGCFRSLSDRPPPGPGCQGPRPDSRLGEEAGGYALRPPVPSPALAGTDQRRRAQPSGEPGDASSCARYPPSRCLGDRRPQQPRGPCLSCGSGTCPSPLPSSGLLWHLLF